jgi:hypothetical protein
LVCERGAGDETLLALAFEDDGFGEESAGDGVARGVVFAGRFGPRDWAPSAREARSCASVLMARI